MISRFSTSLLLGALALSGCANRPEATLAKPGPAVKVATEAVQRRPFEIGYRASGTVRGHATATLTSKGLGHVRQVHVRSGDMVRKGQLLVELEASDVRASVARARAALALATAAKLEAENAVTSARADASLAKSTDDRSRQLYAQNVISRQAYDETDARRSSAEAQERVALARVAAAESGVQEAKAAVAEAQAQLGYTRLTAPFDGQVLERLVDPGTLASTGTPLLVLADDGALRVESFVPESLSREIRLGGPASIELEGLAAPVTGKIGEIVASVDPASRTFLVKVDIPDGSSALRPGTFARVTFSSGAESRLVVPISAIDRFGALERVFVVERGEAELRMVATGEQQAGWATVLSGLSEGESVVIAPPPGLRDHTRVEVTP